MGSPYDHVYLQADRRELGHRRSYRLLILLSAAANSLVLCLPCPHSSSHTKPWSVAHQYGPLAYVRLTR